MKNLDQNKNLEKIDQKFPHSGLIGYGNSIMDFFLASSEVIRLHAILKDSAGAAEATTHQGAGYYYILPQIPSSCLLVLIIGPSFCIFKKNRRPRFFQMLDC